MASATKIPHRKKILLAEDDPANRKAIENLLQTWGWEVDACTNGEELLGKLSIVQPDLVLTDVHMPVMSGIQLTRAIRDLPEAKGQQLPVIAFTSDDTLSTRDALNAAGITAILLKSDPEDTIVAVLEQHLGLRPSPAVGNSFSGLTAYTEGDAAFESELRQLFCNNLEELMGTARQVSDTRDFEGFRYVQHKCKTTLAILADPQSIQAVEDFRLAMDKLEKDGTSIPSGVRQSLLTHCQSLIDGLQSV